MYEYQKVLYNKGMKRNCKDCKKECLAILYCEYCVRNYLKTEFSNWTSGKNEIDDLIKQCQMETIRPDLIVEWIPHNKLKDVKLFDKGGFSEIYTADWIEGSYYEWNSKEKQLKRSGNQKVILKKLVDVKKANRSWFDEVYIL